jgi:hypothetical protein
MFIITPVKAYISSIVASTHLCYIENVGRGLAFRIFSATSGIMADTFSFRRLSVKKQLKILKFCFRPCNL